MRGNYDLNPAVEFAFEAMRAWTKKVLDDAKLLYGEPENCKTKNARKRLRRKQILEATGRASVSDDS